MCFFNSFDDIINVKLCKHVYIKAIQSDTFYCRLIMSNMIKLTGDDTTSDQLVL